MRFLPLGWLLAAVVCTSSLCCGHAPPRNQEEDRIREAVFRYMFSEYGGANGVPHQIFFLAVGEGKDPAPAFLKRFQDNKPPVVKASQAKGYNKEGNAMIDKVTGKKGTHFEVSSILWKSDTEIEAEWHWVYGPRAGMGAKYRVQKQGDTWKVLSIVEGTVYKN